MLSDRLSQLLTAYVDGELSARQQRLVQRLLHRSTEARQLLQQLQNDAEQLRHVPRKKLETDLAPRILLAITDKGLQPARRSRLSAPSAIPSWLGLATAASVLVVISAASYLYFVASSTHAPTPAVSANHSGSQEDQTPHSPALVRDSSAAPGYERLPEPRPDPVVQNAPPLPLKTPPVVPQPDENLETILTTPTATMELFPQIADTKLALILSLAQLDQPRPPKELTDELRKDTAYRIELACHEGGKSMERLRAAFQTLGIRLVIDTVAQDRLKLKLRTSYALYVENVTPDEVTKVLRHLSVEDKKSKPRRQFDQVVLQRMTAEDHQEVSKLLGVDVKAPGKAKSPREVDLHQPLSKATADQVEKSLLGQGGRPTPAKPGAKPGARLAVVVPYNPVRPRAASPQVKQFLDSRKDRLPNTLQLVLVLRGNNG